MQSEPSSKIMLCAARARELIRGARTAVLSTLLADGGAPYGSLVLSASSPDAAPILLLSGLAVHTQNLAQNPRACLLYDGTAGLADPLTGERVSLTGTLRPSPPEVISQDTSRFLARHATASRYAGFADFSFYRMQVDRAHLVAGFGQIDWIEAQDLLLARDQWASLAEAEPGILAHMNSDHSDSIALYASKLLGQAPGPWRMTGVDPEGCDLELRGTCVRLPFTVKSLTAGQVRQELIRLSQRVRSD